MRRIALAAAIAGCGDDVPLPDAQQTPGELAVPHACGAQLHDAGANLVWLSCDNAVVTAAKANGREVVLAANESKWPLSRRRVRR